MVVDAWVGGRYSSPMRNATLFVVLPSNAPANAHYTCNYAKCCSPRNGGLCVPPMSACVFVQSVLNSTQPCLDVHIYAHFGERTMHAVCFTHTHTNRRRRTKSCLAFEQQAYFPACKTSRRYCPMHFVITVHSLRPPYTFRSHGQRRARVPRSRETFDFGAGNRKPEHFTSAHQ